MAKKAIYDYIDKYIISAVCSEPLHVGGASDDKSEVLIHPVDHKPFIQATSICGVLRNYCRKVYGTKTEQDLFGAHEDGTDYESRIRVTDGIFEAESLHMELRPRLKIDNRTGTAASSTLKGTSRVSGHKFDMQYVGAGARFSFAIYYYGLDGSTEANENKEAECRNACEKEQSDNAESIILKSLAALDAGEIQFGGQKSNGCGYVHIQRVTQKHYDMKNQEDRRQWIHEETLEKKPDRENGGKNGLEGIIWTSLNAYEVTILAETENELLVRGISMESFDKDNSRAENMKNSAGKYIIPGSSFKGAVRNRMEMIAKRMNLDQELIYEAFGKSSEEEENGKAGNLRFYDVIVNDEMQDDHEHARTRIRIDKFTGGVRNGALFREINISGDLEITVMIADRNQPDAVLGLLLLALRDLAYKLYALGSGQNVGKGYIDVSEISVRDLRRDENPAISQLVFAKQWDNENEVSCTVKDDAGILENCMKALK